MASSRVVVGSVYFSLAKISEFVSFPLPVVVSLLAELLAQLALRFFSFFPPSFTGRKEKYESALVGYMKRKRGYEVCTLDTSSLH